MADFTVQTTCLFVIQLTIEKGLSYVMNQLASLSFNKLHMVLGVVNDKELDDILSFFPVEATYYFL
jgi:hypothetical protein